MTSARALQAVGTGYLVGASRWWNVVFMFNGGPDVRAEQSAQIGLGAR
jgi:hypothetical protein